jgi:hypothetical protein
MSSSAWKHRMYDVQKSKNMEKAVLKIHLTKTTNSSFFA